MGAEAGDAPGRRAWPVFLVGCHRSGTTAARYLLDAHPEIACPPESKFITALQEFTGAPQVLPALLSLGLSGGEILAETGSFARRLLDLSARKAGKRRWVDKTPNYYRILPFIDDIFQQRVLYLFIVRHPLDTAISLREHFWHATGRYEDPEIARIVERHGNGWQSWAQYWREAVEAIGVFAAMQPDRCRIFKYEDMVREPRAILDALLDFIGESAAGDWVDLAFSMEHRSGYEDPKAGLARTLHGDSIDRWRSLTSDQVGWLWPIVAESAARLGYTIGDRV